ncbi:MAG: peptidoglycan-binding domain-containing protein [Acidimicrobiales bacterium]|nr:peptidoglycan-binding domain-containing protein [Acidimicrobiales bacterium]
MVVAALSLLVVLVAVGGVLVVAMTGTSVDENEGAQDGIVYEVLVGTIERSIPVTVRAERSHAGVIRSPSDGVVTSIRVSPEPIGAGEQLASVDLVPVVLAEGTVPAFRTLEALTPPLRGADVAQLERCLANQGHIRGVAVDDIFTETTALAVRRWQRSIGQSETGAVQLGAIQFVPSLPAVVATADVGVGDVISAGSVIGTVLSPEPTAVIDLGESAGLIEAGQHVRPTQETAGLVEGIVREVRTDAMPTLQGDNPVTPGSGGSSIVGVLETGEGAAVCVADCAARTINGPLLLGAEVVLVPPTTGPVVPIAALRFGPDGQSAVLLANGESVRVTVLAESDGLAVVEGIDLGARVLLSADTSPE